MSKFVDLSVKDVFRERKINFERLKDIKELICSLLGAVKLEKSLVYSVGFYKSLVRESYANIGVDVFTPESIRYGKVFMRGTTVEFNPARINLFLGFGLVATKSSTRHE